MRIEKIFQLLFFSIIIIGCENSSIVDVVEQYKHNKIVFVSTRDSIQQIYIMSLDGTQQKRLTSSYGYKYYPKISPNGSNIVYNSMLNGISEMFKVSTTGENNLVLAYNREYYPPLWLPSGLNISFISGNRLNRNIYTIKDDGTEIKKLTPDSIFADYTPDWSSNNNKIVFTSSPSIFDNPQLFIMDLDACNRTQLLSHTFSVYSPVFSPNGKNIVFILASDTSNIGELWIVNSDGSNLKKLSNYGHSGWDSKPSWSKDGNKVVFMGGVEGDEDIFVINTDGSEQINLTANQYSDVSPSWSVNDNAIIYSSNKTGKYQIYSIDIISKNITQLTFEPGSNFMPSL